MKMFFKVLIWTIVVLYVGFIFSNSLQSGEVSSKISQQVTQTAGHLLSQFHISIPFEFLHKYIRKLAHFSEFCLLGILVSLAIITCPLFKSRLLNFILFLIMIPATDEIIQHFIPARTSAFTDVLIDISGMLAGGLITYIIYLIIKDLFFRK